MSKLVLQVKINDPFSIRTVGEYDFPVEGSWMGTNLFIKDLSIFRDDAEIIFYIQEEETTNHTP